MVSLPLFAFQPNHMSRSRRKPAEACAASLGELDHGHYGSSRTGYRSPDRGAPPKKAVREGRSPHHPHHVEDDLRSGSIPGMCSEVGLFTYPSMLTPDPSQLVVNLVILYYGHILFGVPKDGMVHLTILFNVFVLCQVFNELNARKINDGRPSPLSYHTFL